jgi:hypothetical protein
VLIAGRAGRTIIVDAETSSRALSGAPAYFQSVCPDHRVVTAGGTVPQLPVTRQVLDIARNSARKLLLRGVRPWCPGRDPRVRRSPRPQGQRDRAFAGAGGPCAARTADDLPVADPHRCRGRGDCRNGDLTLGPVPDSPLLGGHRTSDEVAGSPVAARGDRRGGAATAGIGFQSHA